jgi:hypothetical protein
MAFLTQCKVILCKNLIMTLFFENNANFLRRKLAEIDENCYHNIDPRTVERWFRPLSRVYVMSL